MEALPLTQKCLEALTVFNKYIEKELEIRPQQHRPGSPDAMLKFGRRFNVERFSTGSGNSYSTKNEDRNRLTTRFVVFLYTLFGYFQEKSCKMGQKRQKKEDLSVNSSLPFNVATYSPLTNMYANVNRQPTVVQMQLSL